VAVEREDLKQYLTLIEIEIESATLAIEKQRVVIEKQALSGEDHCQALEALEKLRQAQRDLETNRDELLKSINS
jgi:hypothetical protein